MSAITITFGDLAEKGFTLDDLRSAKAKFEKQGYQTELFDMSPFAGILTDPAAVLVVKKGVDCLLQRKGKNRQELSDELRQLDWNPTTFKCQQVADKHEKRSLRFQDQQQASEQEADKSKVIAWTYVPLLDIAKKELSRFLNNAKDLIVAEANFYQSYKSTAQVFMGTKNERRSQPSD